MSHEVALPAIDEVREAAAEIAPYLSLPTPLVHSPALSERLDADVSLKFEFANPIGVFKLRGGVYLAGRLPEEQRRAGLVAASTGNHGQSIAYAAHLHGLRASIFVPEGANADKIASMERLGAEVRQVGARFDDANAAAQEFAAERGMRFVPVDDAMLVRGVATGALEVLDAQQPDTDLAIVPLGAGSGAAGWVTVREGLGAACEVWAAQSAQSPAGHDSWRSGEVMERADTTIVEGVATGSGFATTQAMLAGRLDDFVLVDDARIEAAVVTMLEFAHVLVEPAGAIALAVAEQERERIRGRRVVLVLSGANVTLPQLRELLGR